LLFLFFPYLHLPHPIFTYLFLGFFLIRSLFLLSLSCVLSSSLSFSAVPVVFFYLPVIFPLCFLFLFLFSSIFCFSPCFFFFFFFFLGAGSQAKTNAVWGSSDGSSPRFVTQDGDRAGHRNAGCKDTADGQERGPYSRSLQLAH